MASAHIICCHCGATPAKALKLTRMKSATAATLGAEAKKCGDRRRRTLVDVRRPHVEGHGRDLEGDADEQEHQTEDQADVLCGAGRLAELGNGREARSNP